MRRHFVTRAGAVATLCSALLTGAGGAAAATHLAAAARAATPGGHWGRAMEVAGTGAPNMVGDATVESVSCASAGNCSAGGSYGNRSGLQAFVVNEVNGVWGRAREVAAALNTGGTAEVASVSCASAGNCSAGGAYLDGSGNSQAFVAVETNGTWGTAREVPGTVALNRGQFAAVNSVSCASAGNCGAGGTYTDGSGRLQAFVVSEVNGGWGKAKKVAAARNTGGYAQVYSVSCGSAGNCGAAGGYTDGSGHFQAFVVNEVNGGWGKAKEVAAALNTGGGAAVDSVSCASAGNCSAGGHYKDGSGRFQAFVVNKVNGAWGKAEEVPGASSVALDTGQAGVNSVSCVSAGNCSAGGSYINHSGQQAFVVSEKNATWGTAHGVAAALNSSGQARITAVSCASAGNCSAGGSYLDGSGNLQAFVIGEANGTWGTALEVPGTAALNTGGLAETFSVSCASAGRCSAGGYYSHFGDRAFVANET